jgi:hypothetical protein
MAQATGATMDAVQRQAAASATGHDTNPLLELLHPTYGLDGDSGEKLP